jgi:glycosyltransferase involved in cell wall biosynthesis
MLMTETKPILCHVNLATGFRGGERQTYLLMGRLSNQGWQQKLIARKSGKLAELSQSVDNLTIVETSINPLQYLGHFANVDIVHMHESRAFLTLHVSGHLRQTPYVLTRRVQRKPRQSWLNQSVYSKANAVVTLSDAIGQIVNESLGIKLNYSVIPSAKTGFSFNSGEVQSIRSRLKGDFVVGHIGTLDDSHKGQLQIIETARRLSAPHPEICFVLVGEGRDFELFKQQTASLDNIALVGLVDNVGDYLKAFDIFLFPSRHEGLGSILLDALDFGLPVIATDVGGIPEIIENGVNGFLVKPDAIDDICESILGLYSESTLIEQIARANTEKAKSYTVGTMADKYAQIYQRILTNHEQTP